MKPCKICNEPQVGGYIICADCVEKIAAMEAELARVRTERDSYKGLTESMGQTNAALAKKLVAVAAETDHNCSNCKFGQDEARRCYLPGCVNESKWERRGLEGR